MAQLCEHVQAPPWLSSVLSTPWNAVYTSAVDTVLRAKLRSEWRDVQPVLNEKYRPANPRNPVSLACTYLYGAVGEADDLDAAPLGQVDLLRRRPIASALLHRVIEDLTPLGTLLIIGYDPATDWLRPSDLAGMLAHLSPGQAHVFEHAHSIATDSDLGQLVAAGILVTDAGSLADSLGSIPGPQLGVAAAPRYTFVEPSDNPQAELLPVEPHRRDNISDEALDVYRNSYDQWVTKDHIFAYIYGILHSPDYREKCASDLARMLPRIPEVATAEVFDSFSKAGQQLLELHIGYEAAEPYPLEERLKSGAPDGPERYRVQKMRWGGPTRTPDHSVIVYNDWITLAGIPDEAHEYVVGPRSALEWLLDRYRVTTDKTSGIVNDPNDWGAEMGDPRYIIDLVKRVTTVSVETISIVSALPPLEGGA